MSSAPELEALATTTLHLYVSFFEAPAYSFIFRLAAKYLQLAAFVTLIYDHSKPMIVACGSIGAKH